MFISTCSKRKCASRLSPLPPRLLRWSAARWDRSEPWPEPPQTPQQGAPREYSTVASQRAQPSPHLPECSRHPGVADHSWMRHHLTEDAQPKHLVTAPDTDRPVAPRHPASLSLDGVSSFHIGLHPPVCRRRPSRAQQTTFSCSANNKRRAPVKRLPRPWHKLYIICLHQICRTEEDRMQPIPFPAPHSPEATAVRQECQRRDRIQDLRGAEAVKRTTARAAEINSIRSRRGMPDWAAAQPRPAEQG